MGTRATIKIKNEQDKVIAHIYNHWDGYPDGLGFKLRDFLSTKVLVNGHNSKQEQANGMGCLAAQVVEHLKDGVGGIYLEPTDSDVTEEYYYEIYSEDGKIILTCQDCYTGDQIDLENYTGE